MSGFRKGKLDDTLNPDKDTHLGFTIDEGGKKGVSKGAEQIRSTPACPNGGGEA